MGASDEEVELTVVDHGIGIPTADQSKLGERFYRASNAVTAHIPGTVLRLRMVQSIMSNHHGSFGLSSVEGPGTTATLRSCPGPAPPSTRWRGNRPPAPCVETSADRLAPIRASMAHLDAGSGSRTSSRATRRL